MERRNGRTKTRRAHEDAEGARGLGMSVVVRVLPRLPLGELRPSDPTRGAVPECPRASITLQTITLQTSPGRPTRTNSDN